MTTFHRGNGDSVPLYKVAWERPRKCQYAICVFVINEGEKIQRQLTAMRNFASLIDVIVADGGSTDGSLPLRLMEETECKALLVKSGDGKLSSQMRMAFDYSLAEGYAGILVIDGNGKDGLEAIPTMVASLEAGFDHIQGSRFMPGGHHENTPLIRYLAVNLLHAPLVSIAAGFRYTDTTNGFRGYSRRLLQDPRISVFRPVFDRYQLHYHLAIEAAAGGYQVTEIPVSRSYPAAGKTPTKIRGLGALFSVFRQLISVCRGNYRLPSDEP
ncbi:MAG: glycosyltransferase family 2 protein [Akkermansiaceae bacterium]|nr:glycosyltransferase family 2 protein [Akkermansiaceae bacterium]